MPPVAARRAAPASNVAPFVVLVRGPLGVGKSATARRLARRIGAGRIAIDAILEEEDLEEWKDGYISESSFRRANDFVLARAERLMRAGRGVVVDGNFYWGSAIRDLRRRLPVPLLVFTLNAPLELCIRRDRERRRSYGADAARDVYRKVLEVDEGVRVDATRPIGQVVSEIVRSLPIRTTRPAVPAVRRPGAPRGTDAPVSPRPRGGPTPASRRR